LLVALEASGRAFAPKVKVALRRASPAGSSTQNIERHEGISGDGAVHASAAGVHAPKVQDGVAVFWRQDTWEASSLDFFLTEIKRKLSPSVRGGGPEGRVQRQAWFYGHGRAIAPCIV
jgi:hypothetical protein